MTSRHLALFGAALWGLAFVPEAAQSAPQKSGPGAGAAMSERKMSEGDAAVGVAIADLGDRLRISIDGALFTEYIHQGAPKPYFHPVIGPTGAPMTRNFPMKEVAGEPRDHPHHPPEPDVGAVL